MLPGSRRDFNVTVNRDGLLSAKQEEESGTASQRAQANQTAWGNGAGPAGTTKGTVGLLQNMHKNVRRSLQPAFRSAFELSCKRLHCRQQRPPAGGTPHSLKASNKKRCTPHQWVSDSLPKTCCFTAAPQPHESLSLNTDASEPWATP